MALPDPASPAAVALLQRAIGYVTVDGSAGAQTAAAVRRIEAHQLSEALRAVLIAEGEVPDDAFIAAVIAGAS